MLSGVLTWAEIDLDAIASNVQGFKRCVGPDVRLIGVVKANAYGHGAIPVAKAMLEAGADMLAVHRSLEGAELRTAGIQCPILVMGYTPLDGVDLVVKCGLTPSLMTVEFARALSSRALAEGLQVPVHIKVDSGMSRYGIFPDEVIEFLRVIYSLQGIVVEGLFTHFATADELELTYVRQQLKIFSQVVETTRQAGFHIPIVHAANSAAALVLPEAHFNAVRPGIGLYGLQPSGSWSSPIELQPALSLKSRVCRVRMLPAGAGVSYGRTFVTSKPTLAALVPVGYGDGYHRCLSNQGYVLIRGKRVPIIGRVCMDQFVVDVSTVPDVQLEDEVVVIGAQGGEQIRAEEIARLAGTINYEVTTSLLPRVPRFYLRQGKVEFED